MPNKDPQNSELQGLNRLLTEATLGVTDVVEAVQKGILGPQLGPSKPIRYLISRIAGFTFDNIRWTSRLVGKAIDKMLAQLAPTLGDLPDSSEKAAIRSALNGVLGDYLQAKNNPLQIKMEFKWEGEVLDLKGQPPSLKPRALLMLHGLCMNDRQWEPKGQGYATALAEDLKASLLHLHYNSGRHISSNGQSLNNLLQELSRQSGLEELFIVAHSMGGLLIRSALYYAQKGGQTWPQQLQKIVFLGTPHHGAPLERAGNQVDVILEATPYLKPLARLGKIRSAGITDLRHGNLLDSDWQGRDRFAKAPDEREFVPLPKGIDCYAIAASLGENTKLGDGLVPLSSALGQHEQADKALHFPEGHTWLLREHGHLELLTSPVVYERLKVCLL